MLLLLKKLVVMMHRKIYVIKNTEDLILVQLLNEMEKVICLTKSNDFLKEQSTWHSWIHPRFCIKVKVNQGQK